MRELTNHQRLLSLVALDTHACINWLGPKTRGYGYLRVGGKMRRAHRVAYELAHGTCPELLRHTCDNPACVNVRHLLPGTQVENMQDMYERNRAPDRKGTANGRAVLTDADVAYIRSAYVRGSKRSNPGNSFALAEQFGVHRAQIQRIVNHTQRK